MAGPWIGGAEAFKILKAALGIDPDLPCQKIVVEIDCAKMPIVYVKAHGQRKVVETLAGLLAIQPVADVTVSEQGDVAVTEHVH